MFQGFQGCSLYLRAVRVFARAKHGQEGVWLEEEEEERPPACVAARPDSAVCGHFGGYIFFSFSSHPHPPSQMRTNERIRKRRQTVITPSSPLRPLPNIVMVLSSIRGLNPHPPHPIHTPPSPPHAIVRRRSAKKSTKRSAKSSLKSADCPTLLTRGPDSPLDWRRCSPRSS